MPIILCASPPLDTGGATSTASKQLPPEAVAELAASFRAFDGNFLCMSG